MTRALISFLRRLAGLKPLRSRRRRAVYYLFLFALALWFPARPLLAQSEESPIQDNSFLIEEAYNQEAGVVQHAQTFARATGGGDWVYSFSQEWPVRGIKHQFSYTLLEQRNGAQKGVGDAAINYRYQMTGEGSSRLAIAPRVTLLLPVGSQRRGLGSGGVGFQVMLPVSYVLSPTVVTHWNAGLSDTPSIHEHSVTLGQSIVWLPAHRFNVLLETLWVRDMARGDHHSEITVSPGIRWSHDLANHLQVVPGVAFPMTNPGRSRSVFLYLSLEHPFTR